MMLAGAGLMGRYRPVTDEATHLTLVNKLCDEHLVPGQTFIRRSNLDGTDHTCRSNECCGAAF